MTTTTHPALEQAPKSLREALQRIVDYGKEKRLVKRRYFIGNCHCAIGLFFTNAQIEDILARGCNWGNVYVLAKKFGRENIEAMTGMKLHQADVIQRENDLRSSDLLNNLQRILDTGSGTICSVKFVL